MPYGHCGSFPLLLRQESDQWLWARMLREWPANNSRAEGLVRSYVFDVKVAGTVRVRAAGEIEARKVSVRCSCCRVLMRSGWQTTGVPIGEGHKPEFPRPV